MNTLNWESLEIGETYKYEEGHHLRAEVLILNKEIKDSYIYVTMKVVDAFYKCNNGDILKQVFLTEKFLDERFLYCMDKVLFKTLDDYYDYVVSTKP